MNMDADVKLRLRFRVQQLRALARMLGDKAVRSAIEKAAREIEDFDEETASLFLGQERSSILWLSDANAAQHPGRPRAN